MVNPILDLRSDSYEADAPETVLALLDGVCDPEIPTLTIAELGVLRNARIDDDVVTVVITPTYIGCPAMHEIELNIKAILAGAGYRTVNIKTQLTPAWSSDRITSSGREKLKKAGIAPPIRMSPDKSAVCRHMSRPVCPRCTASDSELVSQFGSTACKAMYRCNSCLEPFEYFKCI